MKSIVKIIISLAVVCVAGCYSSHIRESAIAKVTDIGEKISTKNQYRVTCAYDGDSSQTMKLTSDFFEEINPAVFSPNGIPVSLRCKFSSMRQNYNPWSIPLSVISLGIVPFWHDFSTSFQCFVRLENGIDEGAFFDVSSRVDSADNFGLPITFMYFNGVSNMDGYRAFCQNTFKIEDVYRTTISCRNEGVLGEKVQALSSPSTSPIQVLSSDLMQRALVYAVAVKLKKLEDSGKIDAMLKKKAAEVSTVPKHNIIRLDRDSDKTFTYSFELELAQNPTDFKKAWQAVLLDFAKSLKEDYRDAFPSADMTSLKVSFSGFKRDGLRLSGSAAVLTLKPISLEYNSHNRKGTMSVRFVEGQSSEVSTWIRRNIKTLVRDKNVALTNGSRPSEGKFIIINESISGNVMTIEFKAE
ncbi:MAG: hypothetical protein IKL02_00895 [Kiritimatiellae bacterium]|nr:hypothetical protein [Kiritimatiellia bacterium]